MGIENIGHHTLEQRLGTGVWILEYLLCELHSLIAQIAQIQSPDQRKSCQGRLYVMYLEGEKNSCKDDQRIGEKRGKGNFASITDAVL
jgi:hypothetical protein